MISWFIGFFFLFFVNGFPASEIPKKFLYGCTELFLLKSILPEQGFHVNGATWYLSSMCILLAILYPILRRFGKTASAIVIPMISLFAMGSLYVLGPLNGNMMTLLVGPIQKGLVRAFFGIGFGMAGYELLKGLRMAKLTLFGRILISLIEWIIYIGFLVYTFMPNEEKVEYVLTLFLVLAISLTASKQGVTHMIFQNRVSIFLGKLSLPLFLSHFYYSRGLTKLMSEGYSDMDRLKVYLILTFVTAFAVMFCAYLWRENKDKLKRMVVKIV